MTPKQELIIIIIFCLQINLYLSCLFVLFFSVPPGQPTISINDTRPVKVENDVVALTCLSTEGNPPPTFKWTKNGLVLNSNIVETKVPKETSSSQLTVHLDYSDHLASYSCTVQNSVNQDNPLSVSIQLQVLCKYIYIMTMFVLYGSINS